MKFLFKILVWISLAACSSTPGKESVPQARINLKMATVGIYNFENYIHQLTIYAFSRSSGGYFFYKILAELDEQTIGQLADASGKGDAKLFNTTLPIGEYDLYFLANISGNQAETLQPGISVPADIFFTPPVGGLKDACFLGNTKVKVISDVAISVILHRAVSKLVVTLYKVPSPIDTIRLAVNNITSQISIDGTFSPEVMTFSTAYAIENEDVYRSDTVVYEILTFPTATGTSELEITFRSKSGQMKTKTIPSLTFLPDKFVKITGEVDDNIGGLLDFNLLVTLFIFDEWRDEQLPDFPLTSSK